MPIKRCSLPDGQLGYKWGDSGKCYLDRASAVRQAQVAYSAGYRKEKSQKAEVQLTSIPVLKYNPYHEPAGNSKGGQFAKSPSGSSSGEPAKGGNKDSDVFYARVREEEKKIAHDQNETLIVYDGKGNEIFRKEGDRTSVNLSPKEVEIIKNKDIVMTHNHPSGWSLSAQDIAFANYTNAAEIRAVGRDYVYVMRPTKDTYGWGTDSFHRELEDIYPDVESKVYSEVWNRIILGSVMLDQADFIHRDEVNALIAKRLKMEYIKEPHNYDY